MSDSQPEHSPSPAPSPIITEQSDPASSPSRWRIGAEAMLVFALSWAVFGVTGCLLTHPPTWTTFEFCQYAEIGQNLAERGAFETRLVEPMALAFIDRYQVTAPGDYWPVINRFPLPCFVVAGFMLVFGVSSWAAACSNGLAIGMLAAMTYVMARRWYGGKWAAVAALLLFANPSFYGKFVLLGTPDIWFAVCFLAQLIVWSKLLTTKFSWRLALLFGLTTGLAYLTRFNVILFVAPQAAIMLFRGRLRELAVSLLVTAAVISPLIYYNWRSFGQPVVSIYSQWNLLDQIGVTETEPWLYYALPDFSREVQQHAGGIAQKFGRNLIFVTALRVWTLWHLYLLLPLAILAPWLPGLKPATRSFFRWSWIFFLFQLVVFSALRLELEHRLSPFHGRYFFWFAAPALLMAVCALRRLAGLRRWLRTLAVVVVLAQLVFFAATWTRWIQENQPPMDLGHDVIREAIPKLVHPGRIVASNQPQVLTWYCGLRSVSMPANPLELEKVNSLSAAPIDYLFLDLGFNCIDLDPRWRTLVEPVARSPGWEEAILEEYDYVLPPHWTRPIHYVLLRRRAVPPTEFEESLRKSQEPR